MAKANGTQKFGKMFEIKENSRDGIPMDKNLF